MNSLVRSIPLQSEIVEFNLRFLLAVGMYPVGGRGCRRLTGCGGNNSICESDVLDFWWEHEIMFIEIEMVIYLESD